MKILLFGKNGQVGWELNRSLLPLGEVVALGRDEADFSKPESLRKVIREIKPDVIVNAVAYTAVDKAEEEEELATVINGDASRVLAEEVKKLDALLVHYSTDYVFDGTKTSPYTEEDEPNPLNAYGRSKLVGEKAITESGCKYLIFRTSWVYAARGSNFIKTMLRLAAERDELKVVADQFGAPTSAELIADVTALALYRVLTDSVLSEQVNGIYHLVASGKTSWHGYAQQVLKIAEKIGCNLRILSDQVKPIKTEDYLVLAVRPANSCLDTRKLSSFYDIALPCWDVHVERAVKSIVDK